MSHRCATTPKPTDDLCLMNDERGSAVVIQKPDGSLVHETVRRQLPAMRKHTYYAELPTDRLDEQAGLFESLFAYAIDVLDARHVEVRVTSPNLAGAEDAYAD
jgi:hypothetical protein